MRRRLRPLRRLTELRLFLPAIVGIVFLSVSLNGGGSVEAATLAATTTCSNGVDNTGGLGLICEVTIVNRLTASGGSAQVTVRECHGAAGDPAAACQTTVRNLSQPVTVVNQCNNSINGGGGTLRCQVTMLNHFVSQTPSTTAATVNQCVGSGGGITTGCRPFLATTTSAVVTQCNGSANGGTLVGLRCTVSGTTAAGRAVTINQCNNSANGGGALVICSASITNDQVAAPAPSATARPQATPRSSGSTSVEQTAPPSDTAPLSASSEPRSDVPWWPPLLAAASLFSLLYLRRRSGAGRA